MSYSIKSVKFFDTPDGGGFNCTLLEDGKKVAHVHDGGHGAALSYDCLNGWDFDDYNFDVLVYYLINEHLRKKDEKKGIVVKASYGHQIIQYPYTIPTMIKKYGNGLALIQKAYDEAKDNGEEVLNKDYLQSVGVTL